jgi:hypothetical protein
MRGLSRRPVPPSSLGEAALCTELLRDHRSDGRVAFTARVAGIRRSSRPAFAPPAADAANRTNRRVGNARNRHSGPRTAEQGLFSAQLPITVTARLDWGSKYSPCGMGLYAVARVRLHPDICQPRNQWTSLGPTGRPSPCQRRSLDRHRQTDSAIG